MDRVEKALRMAAKLHDGQYRKGDQKLPYVSHVIAVAFLVQKYGGDEETIAAALLHDTVEDTSYTIEALQADFTEKIATIVAGVTEDTSLSKSERKLRYIENLKQAPIESALVSACDLLHNLRSMVHDYDSSDEKFRVFFFTEDAVELYKKRIAVITDRLGSNAPVVADLTEAFAAYRKLV